MRRLAATGIDQHLDDGCVALTGVADADTFVAACQQLRYWPREPTLITL